MNQSFSSLPPNVTPWHTQAPGMRSFPLFSSPTLGCRSNYSAIYSKYDVMGPKLHVDVSERILHQDTKYLIK